jgi:succinoglycan biosynthesis transport protein ExoP
MTTLTAASPTYSGSLGPAQNLRASGPPPAGFSASDVWRVIRQRMLMIIILWILFCGITVAGTVLWAKYWPSYSAQSFIKVESLSPVDILNPLARTELQDEKVNRMLQDQAVLVRSPQVLSKSIEDPELRATSWFREAQEKAAKKGEDEVDLLGDILNATPMRDTNYVQVSASWRVASEVSTIVNTVVQKYQSTIQEMQRVGMKENVESITSELQKAQTRLTGLRASLDSVRNSDDSIGGGEREVSEEVLTLSALVTELEVENAARTAQYEALREFKPEDLPITEDLQAALAADTTLSALESNLQGLDQNLSVAEARYGKNHRIVRDARKFRDAAADRLAQEMASKVLRYNSQQLNLLRRGSLESQMQVLKVKDKLQFAQNRQRDRQTKIEDFKLTQDKVDTAKAQVERLEEQKTKMDMVSNQRKTVQIEVVAQARTPKRMSNPRFEIYLPVGFILGLFASIGFALLLELADKSVRTARDLLRQQIPVLGSIPTTEDDEIEIERPETASLDAPHSIVAEAFRSLRANLFFSAPVDQQGAILVTSPSGANGKTTVATNLAIAIALSGRRVLLVDANFRRAALPRVFSGMRNEGLSNILIGQSRLDELVTPSPVPGLDLLSSGPVPPNPAELLGSSYLRDLILEARSRYDQVIFDGPPVLLVSDALVLAGAVDGVVLVCQYRSTSRGALQRTQSQLDGINARIFGAVLNKVETRAGGYFRKTYREFYQYSEPDEEGGAERPRLDTAGVVPNQSPEKPRPPEITDSGPVAVPDSGLVLNAGSGDSSVGVMDAPEDSLGLTTDSELGLGEEFAEASDSLGGPEWGLGLDSDIDSLSSDLGDDDLKFDADSDLGDGPNKPNAPR